MACLGVTVDRVLLYLDLFLVQLLGLSHEHVEDATWVDKHLPMGVALLMMALLIK